MLAERTPSSDQYYSALQKFAVFELGLTLLPVATLIEAAQFLVEMVCSKKLLIKKNDFILAQMSNKLLNDFNYVNHS